MINFLVEGPTRILFGGPISSNYQILLLGFGGNLTALTPQRQTRGKIMGEHNSSNL